MATLLRPGAGSPREQFAPRAGARHTSTHIQECQAEPPAAVLVIIQS